MMPRNTLEGSSHITGVGFCNGIDDGAVIIQGSLSGVSIPVGAQVQNTQLIDVSGEGNTTLVTGVDGNKILVDSQAPFSAIGNNIILVTNPYVDGDSIRGHFAIIKASFKSETPTELFCVNLHVTNSNLHHGS